MTDSIASATRHVLPNGMIALLQRNTTTPTVSVGGEISVGAVHEPAERNGLAIFTGAALIRGAGARSFQEIVSAAEERGASVNAGGGSHTSRFGGRCLSEDLPLVLELLADMLQRPTFPEVEVERLRAQFLMGLRESEQDTRTQASRALRALLYPPEHPYSRISSGTIESVQAITRADLQAFHAYYGPRGATVAIVGDIDIPAVIAQLETLFGAWEQRSAVTPIVPAAAQLSGIQRADIPMAGKIQSDIILAVPGLARNDPDFYAASVTNMILGRLGLGGRLGVNIREEQGLAYYAGSSMDADLIAGPWAALAGVNPVNVERTIEAMVHEFRTFCAEGPTAEEMSDAQDYMTGSLVLGLETIDGIAGTLLGIERFNLGLDYIARYPQIIRSIDAEQVTAVARRFLSMEQYAVAVAGPGV